MAPTSGSAHTHVVSGPRPVRLSNLTLTGLDCADCGTHIRKAIAALPGVLEVDLVFATAHLKVAYHPDRVAENTIRQRLDNLGYGSHPAGALAAGRRAEYLLAGLDCAQCALLVEDRVAALPGVCGASVNFGAATLEVVYGDDTAGKPDVPHAVAGLGYQAIERRSQRGWIAWQTGRKAISTVLSGLAFGLGMAANTLAAHLPARWHAQGPGLIHDARALFIMAIVAGGYYMAKAAFAAFKTSRGLEINFLMSVAVLGATALGRWQEAAEVVFLFAAGNALAASTMDRTRAALRALLQLTPATATVLDGDREVSRPLADVRVGSVVLIRPGERIPLDGEVIQGQSEIDRSALTGESTLISLVAGDSVQAGSINGRGALTVRTTRPAGDSVMARIVKLVEEAQRERAPIQQRVDRFSAVYTPAVLAIAGLLAAVPALLGRADALQWTYQAIALLIVSCPCALVVSTPVAMAAAIASASRKGLLIKGGSFLEALGATDVVAFDKTGTLTWGRPAVTDVVSAGPVDSSELLALAASLESRSEHPCAEAIRRAWHQGLHADAADTCHEDHDGHEDGDSHEHGDSHGHGDSHLGVEHFMAIPGRGVSGIVGGREFFLGNSALMAECGVETNGMADRLEAWSQEGKTPILLCEVVPNVGGCLLGALAIRDELRPGAAQALEDLRNTGVRHIVVLTGDNAIAARRLVEPLGVDEIRADLLPDGKVQAIASLLGPHRTVVMVGDGINDAPALATATVGVAMGDRGTAVAVQTADVALMRDDLRLLAQGVRLGRRTMVVIGQNIAFALAVKAALLGLAFGHVLTLGTAVLGDVGTTLLVILNSMRLLHASSTTTPNDSGSRFAAFLNHRRVQA